MKSQVQIIRTKNFPTDAAEFILQQARETIDERDEFRIALSGGHTPAPVYTQLAIVGRDLPWQKCRITFSDERCVPPDDGQSNFRMARETLLAPAAVPDQSIMRLRGEIDPQLAAREYEEQLDLLSAQRGEPIYQHDLILLGLGEDGHTASLFPGTAALREMTRRVTANFVPRLNAWRLTFTYPLINHARHVCFLVQAADKAAILKRALDGDPQLPASHVNPCAGKLTWFIGE